MVAKDIAMTSPNTGSYFARVPLSAAAVVLMLLTLATYAVAEAKERTWTVECGLPQEDDSILALLPTGGYTGPWPGGQRSGHLEAKTLNRRNPEGGVVTEMWLLSRSVGWWKLKSMRVHPDDVEKIAESLIGGGSSQKIRQLIDSPFLPRPAVVRAGDPEGEKVVDGQILALLPDATRLRCGQQAEGPD